MTFQVAFGNPLESFIVVVKTDPKKDQSHVRRFLSCGKPENAFDKSDILI
jgi:hypothetical protein